MYFFVGNNFLQENVANRQLWGRSLNAVYSVLDAYNQLAKDSIINEVPMSDIIWNKSAPLKVNIFACKVLSNKLPTKGNFFSRGLVEAHSLMYVSGSSMEETLQHLFFECVTVGRVSGIFQFGWTHKLLYLLVYRIMFFNLIAYSLVTRCQDKNYKLFGWRVCVDNSERP